MLSGSLDYSHNDVRRPMKPPTAGQTFKTAHREAGKKVVPNGNRPPSQQRIDDLVTNTTLKILRQDIVRRSSYYNAVVGRIAAVQVHSGFSRLQIPWSSLPSNAVSKVL